MRILIGYSMRSGSTLLQHILDQHPYVKSYSDIDSLVPLSKILCGIHTPHTICVKPLDIFYLMRPCPLIKRFDKFVWLARDPRDAYLSTIESKYSYLMWRPGIREQGIDIGLIKHWKRIYQQYLDSRDRWHLLRYEELVADPNRTLINLLDYLELPPAQLLPFKPFNRAKGGDMKITKTNSIQHGSSGRHTREMNSEQLAIFETHIGIEMRTLGYV